MFTLDVADQPHADFDAVVILREDMLSNLLGYLCRAGKIPTRFSGESVVEAPGGELQVSYSVGLAPPSLRIEGPRIRESADSPPAAEGPRTAVITARLAGPLVLTSNNNDLREQLVIDLEIEAELSALRIGSYTLVILRLRHAQLRSFTAEVRDDKGDLDVVLTAYVNANTKADILALIRSMTELQISTGLLRGFIGEQFDVDTDDIHIHAELFEHMLVVTADGLRPPDEHGQIPRGDARKLWNFAGTHKLGAVLHPYFPDQLFSDVVDKAKAQIAEDRDDVKVDSINIRVEADHVRVWGGATAIDVTPGVDYPGWFKLRLRPYARDGVLRIDVYDVEVDVEEWVKDLLKATLYILMPSLAPTILNNAFIAIKRIIGSIEDSVEASAERSGNAEIAGLGVFELPIPETEGRARVVVHDVFLGTAGMAIRGTLKPPPRRMWLRIIGDRDVALLGRPFDMPIELRLAADAINLDDPALRLRWEVYRDDEAEHSWSHRTHYTGPPSLRLDHSFEPGPREYRVVATFERELDKAVAAVWGQQYVTLAETTLKIAMIDRLAHVRYYPMTRWRYFIYEPIKRRIETDEGEFVYDLRRQLARRRSKIHLTMYPGRCREAGNPTRRRYRRWDRIGFFGMKPEQVEAMRPDLCPYCFFGGPDKTEIRPEVWELIAKRPSLA